jgi:hypothetical protein
VVATSATITSSRTYRRARRQRAALRVLREESGTRLDAEVVTAFLKCYTGRGIAAWSSFVVALPERLVGGITGGIAPLAAGTAVIAGLGGAAVDARHRDAAPAHESRRAPLNAMQAPSTAGEQPIRVAIPRTRHGSRPPAARDDGAPRSPSRQGAAGPAPAPTQTTSPENAHGEIPAAPVAIPPPPSLIPATPVAVPDLEPPAIPQVPRAPALPALP